MSDDDVYELLRSGTPIRWLPKSVVYNKVRGANTRMLYVGKRQIVSGAERLRIWDSLQRLKKARRITEVDRGNITYFEAVT